MVTEDGRKMIQVIAGNLPRHSCNFGDNYERAVNVRAKVKVASEQLTIALFDGNTASSPGYNDYLNGYVYIFYGWGNTKHRLTRGAGSSNVWLCDMITASPAQLNNYYGLEARWLDADKTDGDNLFGLVDGEIPAGLEARDGEYTSRTYLGFASWSNAEWRIDRVYVRKCASVEPVAEIGREFNKPAISSPMPTPETTTFEYDDYNKLTEITFPDSATETLSYDDNGQLVKSEKSTGETTAYEWNDAGFLTKIILPNGEPVKYFYDGDNRLVGRESSEGYNEFVQSGWDIVEETDETGRRTYFTGLSAVKEESNAGTEYFHYNHRGDTVLKTDKDGNILSDLSYEAYGKPTDETGIPANEISLGEFPFLYNAEFGIRYDRKTKLHYMRNRWYSGEQMRFISSDLLMDLNRYGYVEGNPISFIDKFGLQMKEPSPTPGPVPIDYPNQKVTAKVLILYSIDRWTHRSGSTLKNYNIDDPLINFYSFITLHDYGYSDQSINGLKSLGVSVDEDLLLTLDQINNALYKYDYIVLSTHGMVPGYDRGGRLCTGFWTSGFHGGNIKMKDFANMLTKSCAGNIKTKLIIAEACCSGNLINNEGGNKMNNIPSHITYIGTDELSYDYGIHPRLTPPPIRIITELITHPEYPLSAILKSNPPIINNRFLLKDYRGHFVPRNWVEYRPKYDPAIKY